MDGGNSASAPAAAAASPLAVVPDPASVGGGGGSTDALKASSTKEVQHTSSGNAVVGSKCSRKRALQSKKRIQANC